MKGREPPIVFERLQESGDVGEGLLAVAGDERDLVPVAGDELTGW